MLRSCITSMYYLEVAFIKVSVVFLMAVGGIEPPLTEHESVVIPLDHTATILSRKGKETEMFVGRWLMY